LSSPDPADGRPRSEAENRSRAVFIDRDGVLIRSPVRGGKPFAIRSLDEIRFLPGVATAFGRLKAAGLKTVIVTNQPDIAYGLVSPGTVDGIHRRLAARLAPDRIEMCPHGRDQGCDCRKPAPGMLLRAAELLDIDLGRSFMIGDRRSDIEAGRAVGCSCIFIKRRYAEPGPDAADLIGTVGHFPAAVRLILDRIGAL